MLIRILIFGIFMDNKSNLYNQIVEDIPLYTKKILSVVGAVIFTAFSLHILHASAISNRSAYLAELGAPYFTHTMNLWAFYVSNFHLLFIFICSFLFFVGLYVIGWLGVLKPKKSSIYEYALYNLFLALIVFSYTLVAKRYELWGYGISVILFVITMSVIQYKNDTVTSDNIGNVKKIENKLIIYFLVLLVIPYVMFFPFTGIFSFNVYIADKYGRSEGKDLLESIKDNEYIRGRNAAIIKSSGEYVYSLDCSESSCFTIRKVKNNELLFETVDRKDLIFKSK